MVEEASGLVPDAILTIRYEDLVADPTAMLIKVCHLLGLNYEAQMVTEFTYQYQRNVVATRETWKSEVSYGNIILNKERWRARIPEANAWLIEAMASDYMQKYGYAKISCPSLREKITVVFDSLIIGLAESEKPFAWLGELLKVHLKDVSRKVTANGE